MNPPINNPNQNDENNVDHLENISSGSSRTRPLSGASHLTRPELLRRRLHNTRRLSEFYQDMYWLHMNQLRFLLRVYILETAGLSPFQEDEEANIVVEENYNQKCAFAGCEKKPMPCTTFCFAHILSDPRQVLYKPCEFVISSAESTGDGAVRCRKPIDRWRVPSYCDGHMQMGAVQVPLSNEEDGAP